jgi:hypothetical protein
MAFLAPQKDDDEQQRQAQPQLGGAGVGASPMTQGAAPSKPAASSPMQAPQRSAMQGKGSNFVNLESFLSPTVAKENQQKVQTLGGQLQTSERDAFNKAADPVRNATYSPIQGSARDLVDKIVPSKPAQPTNPAAHIKGSKVENGRVWVPSYSAGGEVAYREYDPQKDGGSGGGTGGGSMPDPDAAPQAPKPDETASNLASLEALLNQKYNGPRSVDYDASTSKGMQRLGLLGNADTAINALAPGSFTENLPAPTYGQGNRWLDESLIKGDAGTMANIGSVKKGSEAFASQVGDETKALNDKVSGFDKAAGESSKKARGELEGYGKELLSGIDKRAADANTQEAADHQGGVLRDQTTGKVTHAGLNQEQTNNWEAGSGAVGQGANRGNVSTDTERGRLSQIASLLGMDDYKLDGAGNYQSGRYTTKKMPGAMIASEVTEETALADAGMPSGSYSPARAKDDQYRAKGYSVAESIKLAKADNLLTVTPVRR